MGIPLTPLLIISLVFGVSASAAAYVGPGAGITLIGSLIAVIASVLLALVGFVWYPLKRLRERRKKRTVTKDELRTQKRDTVEENTNVDTKENTLL
jgi:putative Mn2+ efflux pump MntP